MENAENALTNNKQFVRVYLAKEQYAIPIKEVNEIIKVKPITDVPNSSPYLLGVINLRGNVVPVISMYKRLEKTKFSEKNIKRIIIINSRKGLVGIGVDDVKQSITFDTIDQNSDSLAGKNHKFFNGLGHLGNLVIPILDIDNFLGVEGELHG